MDSPVRSLVALFAPALVLAAGCTSTKSTIDTAAAAKLRETFVLKDEPDGVQTVSEVRTKLTGQAAPKVLALLEPDHDHDGDHPGETHADEHHDDEHHDAKAPEVDKLAVPAGDLPESLDVVVVGVIGGVPNPSAQTFAEFPFVKNQTMFFVADPQAVAQLEEHGHHHAPGEECAFCEAHAADASELIAAVSFKDSGGKIAAVDARELFGLKEKETVVIRGTARLMPGPMKILTIDAGGLYVRK